MKHFLLSSFGIALGLLSLPILYAVMVIAGGIVIGVHNTTPIPLIIVSEPDQKLELQVVRPTIRLYDEERTISGSAVVIRSELQANGTYINFALTCHHVTVGLTGKPVAIVARYSDWSVFEKNERFPLLVVSEFKDSDLALVMFVSDKPVDCADVGMDEKIYLGDRVIGTGCAFQEPARLDFGQITGLTPTGRLRAQLNAIPGDSGGGLFHNNKLVGIKSQCRMIQMFPAYPPQGVFNISFHSPVTHIKIWQEVDETVALYKKETTVPRLLKMKYKASTFKPSCPDDLNCPDESVSDEFPY